MTKLAFFKTDDFSKTLGTKIDANISNIFIDNEDNIEEYIITNHFDLLNEELETKNEFLNNIEKESDNNNDIIRNYYKIEYDEIIDDDIWLNLAK